MDKVTFTDAEMEVIETMMETMSMSKIEATENMVRYKRNLALHYEQTGNVELAEHLLKELGEWDEDRREQMQSQYQKIILPGDENGV